MHMLVHHLTVLRFACCLEREREREKLLVCLVGKLWKIMERMFEFSSSSSAKRGLGVIDEGDTVSSSSSTSQVSLGVALSESDSSTEELTSSASSSPPEDQTPPPAASVHDMSSLLQQLPFKRGLSKYYQGKSQSFSCLSKVKCIGDLAKPENPYNKKLKTCRSYGGGLSEEMKSSSSPPKALRSSLVSKKSSRGCCSQMNMNNAQRSVCFLGNRPPIPPPHRSTSTNNISNPLFA